MGELKFDGARQPSRSSRSFAPDVEPRLGELEYTTKFGMSTLERSAIRPTGTGPCIPTAWG